ncbi:MAG TPA: ABC transporter permease [bacterium]|nr:ABC transporter permease [bacterium]
MQCRSPSAPLARYAIKRILSIIPICLVLSLLVFAMIHLVPGDLAIVLVGPNHTPETLAKIRESLGLTLPVHVQYLRWLSKAVRGDLGDSFYLHGPVLPEVLTRFRASLLLAGGSFAFAIPLGIFVGVTSALRRGSILGQAMMFPTMVGISIPPFYLGMLLIIVFSVRFQWLPSGGMFSVTEEPTLRGILQHLVLPVLALAGAPFAVVARMVRASALEVLRKDYIRTAHAKGLNGRRVIWRHASKNLLIPVISLISLQIGYLLSATALVEVVFSWPGLGSLIVQSILTRDLPLTQGCVLVIVCVYVVVNTAADLLQLSLDPRIKYA